MYRKNNTMGLVVAGIFAGSTLISSCKKKTSETGSDDKDNLQDKVAVQESKFKEIHGCRGLNICKGLGGCKMTQEQLNEAALKVGIDPKDAGSPHSCKGLNECKGLGGCSVDEEKLALLKEKLKVKKMEKMSGEKSGCNGKSSCKDGSSCS